MKHILKISILLFCLLGALTSKSQLRCTEKSDVLEIRLINNSVKYVDSTKQIINTKGYPILDCTFRDGNCEFPKNRFLARSDEGKYFLLDSTNNVLIDASDSIIGFSYNIINEGAAFDLECYPSYQGQKKIYYQAIRNGYTTLYDYNGVPITSIHYVGEIYLGSYDLATNGSFWVTVNCHCDSMKMGLIDSTGKEIAPQILSTERLISQFDFGYTNLWKFRNLVTNEVQLIDVATGEVVLTYQELGSFKFEFGILVFLCDGKYGLYHPYYGILEKPRYDGISQVDNTNDTYLLTKGKKDKEWWVVSEEIKNKKTH